MPPSEYQKVAVIGSGLIGRAWAIVFARAGVQVNIYDQSSEALGQCLEQIKSLLEDTSKYGLINEPVSAILARIHPSTTLEQACMGVSLVQENIKETVQAKLEIFEQLDRLTPADAVLASSTSWLPTSLFTEKLKGRSRCLVAHPTNPPYLISLVEISPAPWTSQQTVDKAMAFYKSVQQEPVLVKKEIHGFLLNRVQGAVLNEMLNLYEEGFASSEDLDKVMKFGLGLRWSFMGPFETIDLNAPAGVCDYAARYGQTYADVAVTQKNNAWDPEVLRKIEAERRTLLSEEEIAERSRWRDNRLMALRKHQNEQPK
jgi:3-hydroxyacyl-CoA dehydrogenase